MLEPTLESRLAELELKLLGTQPVFSVNDDNISTRLDKLMRSAASSSTAAAARGKQPCTSSSLSSASPSISNTEALLHLKRCALHEDYRVIERLLSELDIPPIAGPTIAAAAVGDDSNINSTPLLFRRMEILASYESMKRDMDLLAQIRDLTSIGTKTDISAVMGGSAVIGNNCSSSATVTTASSSSSRVVNCPIISSQRYNLPSNPETIQQVDQLCDRVTTLSERCAMASQRADCMLNSYGIIMMALSEKIVLVEEQVHGYNDGCVDVERERERLD